MAQAARKWIRTVTRVVVIGRRAPRGRGTRKRKRRGGEDESVDNVFLCGLWMTKSVFLGRLGGGVKKVDTYLVCGEIFCGKGVGCVCDVT
jgi:hypothetical protein